MQNVPEDSQLDPPESWRNLSFLPQPKDEEPGQRAGGSPWPDLSARKAWPGLVVQAAQWEVCVA